MGQTFDCPNCGASLDYDPGDDPVVRCGYCRSSVVVPEAVLRSTRGATSASTQQPFPASLLQPANVAKLDEIGRLARSGDKIEAIKLYRELFGVGLKDAKDTVDRIAAGEPLVITSSTVEISNADLDGVQRLALGLTNSPLESESSATVVTLSPEAARTAVKTTAGFIGGISCLSLAVAIGMFVVILGVTLIGLASPGGPLEGVWNRLNPFAFARVTLAFGGKGSGPGFFTDPRAIAVSPAGDVFVGEYTDGRIQRFDSSGAYQLLWNIGPDQYINQLATDSAGDVYLVARGEIRKYDGDTGSPLGVITHPSGHWFETLAIGADGLLVAAVDSEDILRYNPAGQPFFSMADSGLNQTGDAERAISMALDGLGNIYLLTDEDAVIRYSPDGRLLGRFGSDGDEPGQFRAPSAIAVDGQGRIYVSDIRGIQVFANDGRYLDKIEVEGYAFGLAFDTQNNLWAVTNLPRVFKYQLTGR